MSNQPPPQDPSGQPGDQPYGGQPYGQQPAGQPSYGQPPQGQSYDPAYAGHPHGQPQQQGKGMAIAALVLGVLALLASITVIGIVLGIPFALIALVLGFIASGRAKKGRAGGRGLAITGIVLSVLSLLVAAGVIAFGAAVWQSGGADLAQCVADAGDDQAAIEACNQQFEDQVNENFGN